MHFCKNVQTVRECEYILQQLYHLCAHCLLWGFVLLSLTVLFVVLFFVYDDFINNKKKKNSLNMNTENASCLILPNRLLYSLFSILGHLIVTSVSTQQFPSNACGYSLRSPSFKLNNNFNFFFLLLY